MNESVPITPQQYDFITDIQQKILKKLVSEQSIDVVLTALCSLAESVLDNAVASIMMIDKNTGLMDVLSAPSIPTEGHQALCNLQPGPYGGSCGNAVFYNEAQFVQNTFEDIRWANLRNIAYDFNLCSCWSTPIRDEKKQAIGSFALSSFEHREPIEFHKKLLETCSAIVSIVLAKQVKDKRISLLSIAMDNASEGVMITDSDNKIVEVNSAFENIYGFCEKEILGQNLKSIASELQNESFYQQLWQEVLKKGKWQGEITNLDSSGKRITQWMSITVIKNSTGEVQNYLSIFSDLTDLRTAQKQ
ncbi:MAG: PAS domain S-box protein, partial [Colwellia sp.]